MGRVILAERRIHVGAVGLIPRLLLDLVETLGGPDAATSVRERAAIAAVDPHWRARGLPESSAFQGLHKGMRHRDV
ncbi:MAG: hypothetical protein AABZ12_10090 [Planctomycetota bacterium]